MEALGNLGPYWLPYGFPYLTMLLYQQESKFYTSNIKPIISDALYIHAYKFYTTMGRQPIMANLARKGIFSPPPPPRKKHKNKQNPEELSINENTVQMLYCTALHMSLAVYFPATFLARQTCEWSNLTPL